MDEDLRKRLLHYIDISEQSTCLEFHRTITWDAEGNVLWRQCEDTDDHSEGLALILELTMSNCVCGHTFKQHEVTVEGIGACTVDDCSCYPYTWDGKRGGDDSDGE